MRKNEKKKLVSRILCMMLIVAMALCTAGCNGTKKESGVKDTAGPSSEAKELGEGEKSFDFSVTDKAGNTEYFVIRTDEKTVGEALLKLGLIAGDEDKYGLFVKKVNGVVADFDMDKTYWAFYVNGEYAMNGVDTTPIKEGESYAFKVEK